MPRPSAHRRAVDHDTDDLDKIARILAESTYRLYRLVEEKAPEWNSMTADGRDSWFRMVAWFVNGLEELSGQPLAEISGKLYAKFAPPEAPKFDALTKRSQLVWQAIARYVWACCNDMPEDPEEEEPRWVAWVDQRAPKPVIQEASCPSK